MLAEALDENNPWLQEDRNPKSEGRPVVSNKGQVIPSQISFSSLP
jgi:hypothetical protein